ncbi:hypothetical protein H4219_004790 [Mycoemilia scoparia]|uniref:Major facilitator superfamily (MFS) profile domain-containing protein n=1 Tax=Mycoemilia scoparia TaxID=417184 RepID=A0A9W8DRA0_9FUNG|nr:hypothetical protein H4219_004790 [Mycoemilia scoparia]
MDKNVSEPSPEPSQEKLATISRGYNNAFSSRLDNEGTSTATTNSENQSQQSHSSTKKNKQQLTSKFSPTKIKELITWTTEKQNYEAVLVVVGSFIIQMFTTGIIPIMGIYQAHYLNDMFKTEPATKISWISTTSMVCLNGMMVFGGFAYERIGPRFTCFFGTGLMVLGYVLASFSIKPWQLILTQGLAVGSGAAILNSVAIVIPIEHFVPKRRSMAVGISASGAGIGGVWMAPLTQHIIGKLGVGWALRITGFIVLGACGLCSFTQKRPQGVYEPVSVNYKDNDDEGGNAEEGKPEGGSVIQQKATKPDQEQQQQQQQQQHQVPEGGNLLSKSSPLLDKAILLDPALWLMFMVKFFLMIGINTLTGYTVASARYYKISDSKASLIPTVMGITHTIGNVISGFIADRIGAITIFVSTQFFGAALVFGLWYPATTYAMFMIFSTFFGLLGMNTNNTTPVVVSQLFGIQRLPSTNGIILFGGVIGGICGNYGIAKAYDTVDKHGRFRFTILLIGIVFSVTFLVGMGVAFVFYLRKRKGLIKSG